MTIKQEIRTGKCALCNTQKTLQNSHIMPKFVFKYLKNSGVTKNMRNANKPDQRVQDGHKEYMLCKTCELKFGELETLFAKKVFHAIRKNDNNFVLEYKGDWLYKFYLSIAWRYLYQCIMKNEFEDFHENEIGDIKKKVEQWRAYLNGEEKECEEMITLLPFTTKYINSKIYPDELTKNYFSRTIELNKTIENNGSWGFVYVKMPFVAGCINFKNSNVEDMEVPIISKVSGILFGEPFKVPELIVQTMQFGFNSINAAAESMSESQKNKIIKDALKMKGKSKE
ncbi:hypothetical protein [Saccharibacillus sp. JS10]|uniref:hypothetical protein n=1 Tax=Saccharibacillus sp. JS10 TaxID=2950552 RepID=UPI00210BA234|nr:hypothetical protein [Saccharibacillus sp. JS10]MCQ4088447.1 hypothetical protein [Saccharibacillus sp. JS10]